MKSIEIIPAILTDKKDLAKKYIQASREFADVVQIDVGDGSFAQTKTLQAKDFSPADFRGINIEVQLMVYHPEQYIEDWLALGAKRIIIHAESQPKANVFHTIRDAGREVLVGLTAKSDIDVLEPYLHLVSGVLFLSISPPGMQGQSFLPEVAKRARHFHELHPEYIIEIDGGISEQTFEKAVQAGATRLVMGSALFAQKRTPKEQYDFLSSLLEQYIV